MTKPINRSSTIEFAQSSTPPMKALDDVRDRRYCELFVVKRQGAGLVADVYNTLGLNDCPQAAWDALDTAKVASEFGAVRVIRNGPRHFLMDRLASGDVTRNASDIQGLGMRPVATMKLGLLDLVEKRAFYVERTIGRTTDWIFLTGKPVYELISPKGAAPTDILDARAVYENALEAYFAGDFERAAALFAGAFEFTPG